MATSEIDCFLTDLRSSSGDVYAPQDGLVLLVDDVVDISERVAEDLEPMGLKTVIADSGISALRSIMQYHPQIIVLDYEMPSADKLTTVFTDVPAYKQYGIIKLDSSVFVKTADDKNIELYEILNGTAEYRTTLHMRDDEEICLFQRIRDLVEIIERPEFIDQYGDVYISFNGDQVCLAAKSITGFRKYPEIYFFTACDVANGTPLEKRLKSFGAARCFMKSEYKTSLLPFFMESCCQAQPDKCPKTDE